MTRKFFNNIVVLCAGLFFLYNGIAKFDFATPKIHTSALTITKTAPDIASYGDYITYTLTVSNTGNEDITDAIIWDVVPANAHLIDIGNIGTMNIGTVILTANNRIEWHGIDVPSHNSLQVQFSVTASESITNADYGIVSEVGSVIFGNEPIKTIIPNNPAIVFSKTVGLTRNKCAISNTLTLPAGGDRVTYCYQVHNVGDVTLNMHDLVDDKLGDIFTDMPYTLPPDGIFEYQERVHVATTTVNTAMWIAYNQGVTKLAPTHNPSPTGRGDGATNQKLTIVGGQEAIPGFWSHQVALFPSTWRCGGSVIDDEWILTAAHCMVNNGSPLQPSVVNGMVGVHDIANSEDGNQSLQIEEIFVHENYNSYTFDNDIALLKLAMPIELGITSSGITVGVISLVEADVDNLVGLTMTMTGWGATSSGGQGSDVLLQVDVPVISNDACQDLYEESGAIVTDNMLCAVVDDGGKDACQGDSGGPAVYYDFDQQRWQQAGIISWGIGCADKNHPGVYTRLSNYVDWIESKTGALNSQIMYHVISETAVATVTVMPDVVIQPAITVTKHASRGVWPYAPTYEGQVITYTYQVTNTGNMTLTIIGHDDKLGDVVFDDNELAINATISTILTYTVGYSEPNPIVNTVVITGMHLAKVVSVSATESVMVDYDVPYKENKIYLPFILCP